jgi:tetratricopeptide (TPR) repeat protein
MRKLFFLSVLTITTVSLATLAVAQQQGSANAPSSQTSQQQAPSASAPNDIPTPDDDPSATTDSKQTQTSDQQADEKKPTRGERLKKHMKEQMSSWCVGAPVSHCYEKDPNAKPEQKGDNKQAQNQRAPRSDDPQPRGDDENGVATPPATPGESSSKDTKVDLSPPPGDANEHPDSSVDDESSGTSEFRAWDPHRAMKNVEVGDYYYKQQNYRAAASRYQEALQWKPRDAEATFKLADAYEKLGDTIDARDKYETYLKILPKGPRADDAHKALARLK